jgi:phosphoribosylglycinamide formyltransferase-1
MIRIGVLASGSGSNLQAIMDACAGGLIEGTVAVVVCNVEGAYALERARRMDVPSVVVPHERYPDRDAFDAELARILEDERVDLVALAGFMRVLTPAFLRRFPGRIMNIHPALLPSFPGLHVRQRAIDYGVRFSGCTVHFVDEGIDTGPIIIQAVVPVYPDDTEEELNDRILKLEHRIYPRAIQLFAEGRLVVEGRRVKVKGLVKEPGSCLVNPGLEP